MIAQTKKRLISDPANNHEHDAHILKFSEIFLNIEDALRCEFKHGHSNVFQDIFGHGLNEVRMLEPRIRLNTASGFLMLLSNVLQAPNDDLAFFLNQEIKMKRKNSDYRKRKRRKRRLRETGK